jgi:hypothetical protein
LNPATIWFTFSLNQLDHLVFGRIAANSQETQHSCSQSFCYSTMLRLMLVLICCFISFERHFSISNSFHLLSKPVFRSRVDTLHQSSPPSRSYQKRQKLRNWFNSWNLGSSDGLLSTSSDSSQV